MNNGGSGGESSKVTLKKRSKNDEFAHSLATIAVAQICESVGLHGFQKSAGDVLSDVMCKYIQNVGKKSNFYANLSGRTQSNVFDIIHGLEELGISQGFVGASYINRCLSDSGVIKEISRYVGVSEEVGFAYSVPRFPVIKERESTLTFSSPVANNIPPWLPCFPDFKTVVNPTSLSVEQTVEINIDQDQKVIESPMLKREQPSIRNGFHLPVVELGVNGVCNPFLAPVLEYGDKDVALVCLPDRLVEDDVAQNDSLCAKDVSVFQDVKSSDLDTDDERVKKVAAEKRPVVQFKFHTCKKYRKVGSAEGMYSFENDDSMDDKKDKKVNIVKESSENGIHMPND